MSLRLWSSGCFCPLTRFFPLAFPPRKTTPVPEQLLQLANGALDQFYAAKLKVAEASFLGGGNVITQTAKNIELVLNNNDGTWPGGLGPAVVDWAATYGEHANSNGVLDSGEDKNGNGQLDNGLAVPTGRIAGNSKSVEIGFDGNQRMGISVGDATVKIFDFVHINGSFFYEMGPQQLVTLGTGIPQNIGNSTVLQTALNPFVSEAEKIAGVDVATNFGSITGWDVATTMIGASSIDVFVGLGSPDFTKADWTTSAGLFGYAMKNAEFGFAMGESTAPEPVLNLVNGVV